MRLSFFASSLVLGLFSSACGRPAFTPPAAPTGAVAASHEPEPTAAAAPAKLDRAGRAQALVQKLSAIGLQATTDSDHDVVFRSGAQSYMLSTEKAHFFRLERPTQWAPKNGADRTDMLRALSKLNAERRWVKFSYLAKAKVVTLGIEQLVATDDDMVSLMPKALEYLHEAEKKLPSRAQRTPSVLGLDTPASKGRWVGSAGPLARHYAEMLSSEGTESAIDSDGDVVFAREGIKLFVSVHEDSPEYLRLVSLWGGKEFPGNESRKLEVCNDINARVAIAKCSVLRGDIVISSEQMIGDETQQSGQFKGGVRSIGAAAQLLREAAGEGGADSDPLSAPSNPSNLM